MAPALLEGEAEGVDDPRLTDEHVPDGGPSQGPGDAGRDGGWKNQDVADGGRNGRC